MKLKGNILSNVFIVIIIVVLLVTIILLFFNINLLESIWEGIANIIAVIGAYAFGAWEWVFGLFGM